jgi:hypothetical protein
MQFEPATFAAYDEPVPPGGAKPPSAGLEGEEVPFDGFFGLGQLGVHHAELVLVLAALHTGSGETRREGSLEEVVAAKGPKERAAHFALQLVGGEPFGRAGGGPVALTREAGAASTGQRKKLGELGQWCQISEGLARPVVEARRDSG